MNPICTELGEIISLEYGKALRADDRDSCGNIPVAGSNGISGFHSEALVKGPGIVVGRKGSAGKVNWFDSDFWCIDTTFYVQPKITLELKWVYYLLQHLQLERLAIVTGVPGLNRTDAYQLKINLITPKEQRLIVEILDQADELRRKRTEADAIAERILPALFMKMFGDPLMNPKVWNTEPLIELAEKFSDGPFGSNLKTEHYTKDGIRVIRLQNIGVGKFLNEDKAFISLEHFSTLKKHRCLPGDVIVGTMGDPNIRACILPDEIPEALNKADCVQIRAKPKKATAEYISWLLNLPSTLRMASNSISGQTRSRISMGRLREIVVPVPPYELQQTFSTLATNAQEVLNNQEKTYQEVERLFNVLLHRAFSSELTAKWREANMKELLEEIEIQRHELNRADSTAVSLFD